MISSESGAHVGNTVPLENTEVINFFLSNITGNPLIDIGVTLYDHPTLHSMAEIVSLMQARAATDVTPILQPRVNSWVAGAATGGLGVSEQPTGQGALDYYGTDGNNYLYANNNDNIIYGYAGNDTIFSFAGNDIVYAGDGHDTISTAQGNDAIDAGDGSDTIYAGSGDDEIDLGRGNGTVDGGAGYDTLTFDLGDRSNPLALSVGTELGSYTATYWYYSSFEALKQGLAGKTAFYIYNGATLQYANVEAVNWTAGSGNDLLVYQGGTHYDGGAGTDTFYADRSGAAFGIIWNNNPVQNQTVNGVSVSGFECLLITTGSGNDTITNRQVNSGNDYIDSGAGNDIINGGAGADTMIGGLGNDIYWVDDAGDVVIETSTLANEIDQVNSSITYALRANVEDLNLKDLDAINGTGNGLNNILTGNAGANTLNGGAGADQLIGGAGNDILNGGTGDDILMGDSGDDSLNGGTGADRLIGGSGNDVLIGGAGMDIFKFTNLSLDTITDFSVADDTIQLENSVFSQLTSTGALNTDYFKTGTAAADANDYVIYDNNTGALYYDADGNGAGAATQIALLGTNLALTAADFLVI